MEVLQMNQEQQIQMAYQTIKSAIFGHVVGDVLGVPVEFVKREKLEKCPVTDMLEFGTHNQPKGTWSDDTSMTLCTLDSLTKQNAIITEDIMSNFYQWLTAGKFTPFGRTFGVGRTTLKAIANYRKGKCYICSKEKENGNGSLMRILPILLYQHFHVRENISLEQEIEEIHTISALTHAHERSLVACGIYKFVAEELLHKLNKSSITKGLQNASSLYHNSPEHKSFSRLFSNNFSLTSRASRASIKSSGYIVDTLESAIWCLLEGKPKQLREILVL